MSNSIFANRVRNQWVLLGLLGLMWAGSLLITFHPVMRNRWQEFLEFRSHRKLLSTAFGNLSAEGGQYRVIKVQEGRRLFLEVYGALGGVRPLITRIELPDSWDAFYHVGGNSSNLALSDLDGDGRMEIIAPTLDDQLKPRLNVYRFDNELKQLLPFSP